MYLKRENHLLSMTEMILCLLPIVPIRRRSSIDPSTDWATKMMRRRTVMRMLMMMTMGMVRMVMVMTMRMIRMVMMMTMRMMRMVMVMPIRHISSTPPPRSGHWVKMGE